MQYMQEFVFRVSKPDSSIAIKLKSYRVLGRNPDIGTACFTLSDLVDGTPTQLSSKMQDGGRLEVILCRSKSPEFAPPVPHHKMHTRLPSLRFVLEKDVYFPGDVVRGYVRYFERFKNAISVLLSFDGYSRVYLTDGSDDPSYTSNIRHLQHTSVLFGSRNPYLGLKVNGQFLFQTAFEFRLPTDLPPTYQHTSNWNEIQILYSAILRVERGRFASKQVSIPFRVLPPLTPPCLDIFRSSIDKIATSKDIYFSIEGPRTLVSGGSYQMKVIINNTKRRTAIQSLKIKLRVHGQYRGEDKSLSLKKTIWVVHFLGPTTHRRSPPDPRVITMTDTSLLPIAAGVRKEVVLDLPMPPLLDPAITALQCPIIQTQHYLEAKITTDYVGPNQLEVSVALPVDVTILGEQTKIPSAANPLQCLAYGLKGPDIISPVYVPPLSIDGKTVKPELSMQYGNFDFSNHGENIEPEAFNDYENRTMKGLLLPLTWTPGTLASWLAPTNGVPPVSPTAQLCNITPIDFAYESGKEESSSSDDEEQVVRSMV